MPELPEVEVIRRGLVPQVLGRTVLGVTFGPQRLRRQSSADKISAWVAASITGGMTYFRPFKTWKKVPFLSV